MKRYDDSNFNDALGQMIQWSLRADVAQAKPASTVWQHIEQRIQVLAPVRDQRTAGRMAALLQLLRRALQLLEDSTVSSEAIWLPNPPSVRVANAIRYRANLPLPATWPVLGQLLPIF